MISKTTEGSNQFRTIGTRPIRHDGVDKVTGRAMYAADIKSPGLLYGKILRSPHAHAIIKAINVEKAKLHPGVKAVITCLDLPFAPDRMTELGEENFLSLKYLSNNVLAFDKVLYRGHAIAAVAAENVHVAEEALHLIEVEYEVLPSVTNVEDAMKADAPILHEHINTGSFPDASLEKSNIASHQQFTRGDIKRGFEESDIVIEGTYRTSSVHQGYIEPQSATGWWSLDGRVSIWTCTQAPFEVRGNVAKVLGLPVSKIKLIPSEIGGGFGGKLACYLEPVAALLSRKSGKPVKLTLTRSEVLEATGPTSGSVVNIKMGASREGKILGVEANLAFEAGAYPGSPIGGAMACMLTPYDVPNFIIDGYDVVDNKPKTTAYRAPGAPIGGFAVESLIDEISRILHLDPIKFRLNNAAKEGSRRPDGIVHSTIGCVEILEAVLNHPHYSTPLKTDTQGRGVAIGFWRNNSGPSSVVASVNPDGTVGVVEGSVDIGGSRVAIAQQFAEALGIPVEDTIPTVVDTDGVGYTSMTAGSGVQFKTGWAAYKAAEDIKTQVKERASLIWDVPVKLIEYSEGVLYNKNDRSQTLNFREIAALLNETGGPIIGRGNVNPGGVGASVTANIIDVEIDLETGKVSILRCTAFQDPGRAIHPSYVEGQMQGGTVQGIGWALNEEYFIGNNGEMLNNSFLDYRMPTSLDVPMIDTMIVEVPNPGHPFGVRGVGEASIIPPLAAVANALRDAGGIRMMTLPLSPTAVLDALSANEQN